LEKMGRRRGVREVSTGGGELEVGESRSEQKLPLLEESEDPEEVNIRRLLFLLLLLLLLMLKKLLS